MRHTFASWAIAGGLSTFEIAATMGSSLEQLSETYAHLLPDSAEQARMAQDLYLSEAAKYARKEDGNERPSDRVRERVAR